jgi:tetratricopeptide (TPR) repeat protein
LIWIKLIVCEALVLCPLATAHASEVWDSWMAKGNALYETGKYAQAAQAFQEALVLVESSTADQRQLLIASESLASAYADAGQLMQSERAYQRALAAAEKLEGVNSLDYAFLLASMVDLRAPEEISQAVIAQLRRPAAMHSQTDAPDKLAVVRLFLADILLKKQKNAEAEQLLLQVRRDLLEHKTENPRTLMRVLNSLIVLRFYQGRYTESLNLSHEFLRVIEARYGREHPMVIVGLSNIATDYLRLGQLDASLAAYERAVAIATRTSANNDTTYADLLANYSLVLRKLGRKGEARLVADQSRQMHQDLDRRNGTQSTVSVSSLRAGR